MYPKAKDAILKNRSTLLKLADQEKIKYILVSSALYEKKLLPKVKYVEIRDGKTREIDRVEALLEWLDDCSSISFPEIFDGLCEGLKRSDQQNLGRKLKREAKENGGELPRPGGTNDLLGGPIKSDGPKQKKPKTPKLKLPKVMMDILDDGGILPNGAKKPKTKTQKPKVPRPSKANGEINTPSKAAPRRNSIKQANAVPTTSADVASDTKILSPVARKRKSANASTKAEHALVSSFDPRNSVFGYPLKANMGKAMSFKAAKDAFTKKTKSFNFVSFPSKPTRVYFQNKSDLFYDGCAFPVTVGLCTKKVTQRNNSYICSSKHESPMFRKVPRVDVTFDDGTDALDVTLWKSSVEIFTGKSSDDLEKLDDASIRQLFDATRGKEATLLVEATKTHQRDLKKTQGREWTMNATVLVGDNIPPPAKKQRG